MFCGCPPGNSRVMSLRIAASPSKSGNHSGTRHARPLTHVKDRPARPLRSRALDLHQCRCWPAAGALLAAAMKTPCGSARDNIQTVPSGSRPALPRPPARIVDDAASCHYQIADELRRMASKFQCRARASSTSWHRPARSGCGWVRRCTRFHITRANVRAPWHRVLMHDLEDHARAATTRTPAARASSSNNLLAGLTQTPLH